jgi:hypothetical protein
MNVTKWFAVALLMVFGLAGIAAAKEKKGGKEKWLLYCENNAGKYYYDPDAIAFGSKYMHFKVKYKVVLNEPEKEQLLKNIKKPEHYGFILADLDIKKETIKLESEAEYLGKEKKSSRDYKDFIRPLTWEEHKKLADIVVKWFQKWQNTNPAKAEKYFAKGADMEEACKIAESELRNGTTTIEAYYADNNSYPKNRSQLIFAFRNYTLNGALIYEYYGQDKYKISSLHQKCEDIYFRDSATPQIKSIPKTEFQSNSDRSYNGQEFNASLDDKALAGYRWTSLLAGQKNNNYQFTKDNKVIYKGKELVNMVIGRNVKRIAISPLSPDAQYAIIYSYDSKSVLADSYLINLGNIDVKRLDLKSSSPIEWVYWPSKGSHAIIVEIASDNTYEIYKLNLSTLAVSDSTVDSLSEE